MDKLNTKIPPPPNPGQKKPTSSQSHLVEQTCVSTQSNSPSIMAFIVTTISTQIIPLQHKPRGQPSTQSPTAEATHCRLSIESLLRRVSGHAGDDLQLCTAKLPLRNTAMTHTAKPSSRRAVNNGFYSAHNTPNCQYRRKKNPARTNSFLPATSVPFAFQRTALTSPIRSQNAKISSPPQFHSRIACYFYIC